MQEINAADWLTAVDAHRETIDTDLLVAVAVANGETSVDGLEQETVDETIEELIGYGFLESVFSASCSGGCVGDCEEHVLELRLPESSR